MGNEFIIANVLLSCVVLQLNSNVIPMEEVWQDEGFELGQSSAYKVLRVSPCWPRECDKCIDTPDTYADILNNLFFNGDSGQKLCVARNVMGTILGPYTTQAGVCARGARKKPTTMDQFDDFYYPWISGSVMLEHYLNFVKSGGSRLDIVSKMLEFTGMDPIDKTCSYILAVIEKTNLEGLFAPSWAQFFLELEGSPFNVALNNDVSKQLVQLAGPENWTKVTGCPELVSNKACSSEYWEMHKMLSASSSNTVECVAKFARRTQNGWAASLKQARAFFDACFRAGPEFYGNGYDETAASLSNKEFLTKNRRLDNVDAVVISLYPSVGNQTDRIERAWPCHAHCHGSVCYCDHDCHFHCEWNSCECFPNF